MVIARRAEGARGLATAYHVMARLLDPKETHGIGRAFLEWFLGQARLPGKMPGNIVRGDGGQQVRVERELYYVDVTIFLESDQGRHIVAIENKPGWASKEHYEQARDHVKRRCPKYSGHDIHGVLLSSSREGIDGEDDIAHVSWRDVGARIKTMHGAGAFGRGEVAAFIRPYLVAVGRLIGPEESDADYFRKLMDDHHSLLKHMSGVLGDEEGEDTVRAMVPERHAHYRDTVVRLAKDFGQEPTRLRDAVLSGTSTAAVTEAVRQAVAEFLDAEDSDYTRINDYFRCLSFE
ncbi:MAG: PD-(D/E)XK nuclease family protein [Gemmatimonadota bacterium]|nr:PD-(D/E)XK nuclease family protein [Gemmatimonadota bacterium]MDE2873718.1 PD-(D/E)XK nuclease family protein [Gemmatimonadota bacterium]